MPYGLGPQNAYITLPIGLRMLFVAGHDATCWDMEAQIDAIAEVLWWHPDFCYDRDI
jgi:hypothetical protein